MQFNDSFQNHSIHYNINSDQYKQCFEQFSDQFKIEDKLKERKEVLNRSEECLSDDNNEELVDPFETNLLFASNESQFIDEECVESEEDLNLIENQLNFAQNETNSQSLSHLNTNNEISKSGEDSESVGSHHRFDAFGDCLDSNHLNDKRDDKLLDASESDSNNNKEMVYNSNRIRNNYPTNCWKSKEIRLLEKWGESVGIYDTFGSQKRIVTINELNNYLELKLTSLYSNDYTFYCSLINSRYPRFYTSTVNYCQRWRMRYNLFVDKLFNNESNHSSNDSKDSLLLHIGEIHLYFDIVPKYCEPVYVNSSFYQNKNSIIEVSLDELVVNKITKIVNSIRYSKDIFQLKFPVNDQLFHKSNHIFDKFMERQMEFVEEAIKVFRKNQQKNPKFQNCNYRNINTRREQQTRERSNDWDLMFEKSHERHQTFENRTHSMNNKHNNRGNGRGFQTYNYIQRNSKPIEDENAFQMEWNDSFGKEEPNGHQNSDYENHRNETSLIRRPPFQRQSLANNRNNDRFTQFDNRREQLSVFSEENDGMSRANNSRPRYHSNIDN